MSAVPTRRAMLGAIALAIPTAAIAKAITIPASDTSWDKVMRLYKAAKAACDAHDREYVHPIVPPSLPVGPERSAAVDRVPNAVWAEAEPLTDLLCAYEDQLMAMPSPHIRALAWKLERLLGVGGDDGFTSGWSANYVAPTLADVRRLAAREA